MPGDMGPFLASLGEGSCECHSLHLKFIRRSPLSNATVTRDRYRPAKEVETKAPKLETPGAVLRTIVCLMVHDFTPGVTAPDRRLSCRDGDWQSVTSFRAGSAEKVSRPVAIQPVDIDSQDPTSAPFPIAPPRPARWLAIFAILTPSEQNVLAELMKGQTAEAIATNGWLEESTVRSQIRSIRQKLGVNSPQAAVVLARQAGWSNGEPTEMRSSRPDDLDQSEVGIQ